MHFPQPEYLFRRKVFTLFGGKFHIYGKDGALVGFCKQKAFKLKEDLRLYADDTMKQELLIIKARSVIDFGATYDVYDPQGNILLGSFRRQGLKSVLRDTWTILTAEGNELGTVTEDSWFLSIIRRFITNLVPQTFIAKVGLSGQATLKQNFNPFVQKIRLDLSRWPSDQDRRLAVAMGILMLSIEGKQQ